MARRGLSFILLGMMLWMSTAVAFEPFAWSEATVVTLHGRFPFTVEMAVTPDQHRQGLQGRRAVPDGTGMLFDFGEPRPIAMWMFNTPSPLDMLFIDSRGRVVRVAADTVPFSREVIRSGEPVRAVLEVAAGTAARLGIRPGSRVLHPMFDTP